MKATLLLFLAAASLGAQSYSVGSQYCGPPGTQTAFLCNNVPVLVNGVAVGTIWINSPDWILWQGALDTIPMSTISKAVCMTTKTYVDRGHTLQDACTWMYVFFYAGDPAAADYKASATLYFDYFYSDGGGGRGGGGAGWHRTLTKGQITFIK